MISDDPAIRAEISARMNLLDPSIMAKPIVYLCSDEAGGITGERIVALEFDAWLQGKTGRP